jgi:hypothetical protein
VHASCPLTIIYIAPALTLLAFRMPPKFNPELIMNGLGVLALMAEAVPIFGAPVKASAEALKQIMHYAEVGHSILPAESFMQANTL